MDYKKFLFLTDTHWGFERKNGHKTPLHDQKALNVALEFAKDFKPNTVILGGDILDAGCVSHHNEGKPGRTEGMRLIDDAEGCQKAIIIPLERLNADEYVYILGNHDGGWLNDFEETYPALQGMINVKSLLHLNDAWNIIEQGGHYNKGKLTFVHGDQISGGEHSAKAAVIAYERSVRLGHFHTAQMYTKNTPIDNQLGKTGVCVPCLCKKDPHYGKGKPNRHVQGFCFGYVFNDGTYSDQLALITNGRAVINGKVYNG